MAKVTFTTMGTLQRRVHCGSLRWIYCDQARPFVGLIPFKEVELSLYELNRAEYSIRRIRGVVGDRADILLGTHGQMTTTSAIRLARRIERFDPLWFEGFVRLINLRD